ncbi:MAG TPA: hypothetical protein VLH77_04370 [Gammaproteobacteria bacterium]|nr:hypothetical protein [Gammaproteobacteria bacterium]
MTVRPVPVQDSVAQQPPAGALNSSFEINLPPEILSSLKNFANIAESLKKIESKMEGKKNTPPPFYKRHLKPILAGVALGTLAYCYPQETQNLIAKVQDASSQALNQTLAAMPQGLKDFGSAAYKQTAAMTPQPVQDLAVNLATSARDAAVTTGETLLAAWDIARELPALVRYTRDGIVTINRVAGAASYAAGVPSAVVRGTADALVNNNNPSGSFSSGTMVGMGGINIASFVGANWAVNYIAHLPGIKSIPLPKAAAPLFKAGVAAWATVNTALNLPFGIKDVLDPQSYKNMFNYGITSAKDTYNYVKSPEAAQKASNIWTTVTTGQSYKDLGNYLISPQFRSDAWDTATAPRAVATYFLTAGTVIAQKLNLAGRMIAAIMPSAPKPDPMATLTQKVETMATSITALTAALAAGGHAAAAAPAHAFAHAIPAVMEAVGDEAVGGGAAAAGGGVAAVLGYRARAAGVLGAALAHIPLVGRVWRAFRH